MPFPSAETTPPVTKTYFGARALTGFKGSSAGGRRGSRGLARPEQAMQPVERLPRKRAPEADQPGPVDDERRLCAVDVEGPERQLGRDPVTGQLERDSLLRHDVDDQQRPGGLRASEITRLVRADHLPPRARREAAPVRLDARDTREPVREVVRLAEERPPVGKRREEDPGSCVPWQGTPGRRASARARPSAPRRRAA